MSKLPINYQTIVHIINNWNFTYENNHVKASLDVFVDLNDLRALREEYQTKVSNPNEQLSDEDRKGYVDAINELNLAISELESN